MDRPRQTPFDYVVAAISPALIIALVGSLVYFLTAVFYRGEFQSRMLFILGMFVMAAVLIARLAITQGGGYAAMFAIPLAIVTGLAMMKFVEVRGLAGLSWAFNWSMIALVWWCSHKLTKNCTLIDESEDASGEGLLQSFGWDRPDEEAKTPAGEAVRPGDAPASSVEAELTAAAVTAPANAKSKRRRGRLASDAGRDWEEVARERAVQRKKRRTAPGVWVIFFSLAALPIFGIGQGFIPASDLPTRRFAFWMLCIYVLSGLGLLLTTSLLGLRRYLRQRMLEMPAEMTGAWLSVGALLIVGLLAAVWILPRPSPEYSLSHIDSPFGSPDGLRASRWAVGNDAAEEGESKAGGQKSAVGGQRSEVGGQQGGGRQQGGAQQQGGGQQQGNGQSSSQQSAGQQQSSQGQGQTGQSQSGQSQSGQSQSNQTQANQGQENQGHTNQSQTNQSQTNQSQTNQSQNSQSQNSQGGNGQTQNERGQNQQEPGHGQSVGQSGQTPSQPPPQGSGDQTPPRGSSPEGESSRSWFRDGSSNETSRQEQPASQPNENETTPSQESSRGPSLTGVANGLWEIVAGLLKFLYYLIFAAIAAYFLWKYRRQLIEGWRALVAQIKAFFSGLKRRPGEDASALTEAANPLAPPRPFADFADPFASGAAARWSPEELVRYSFQALEAWARERGCARRPEQTAWEFADSLGRAPALGPAAEVVAPHAAGLADLYSRAAYARGPLPATTPELLRRLWQSLAASV